jgi:hypothetical protein
MRTFVIATMTLAMMATMMAATLYSGTAGAALARAEGFSDVALSIDGGHRSGPAEAREFAQR